MWTTNMTLVAVIMLSIEIVTAANTTSGSIRISKALTTSTLETQTSSKHKEVNLTQWRQHRRQKRFLIFADAGSCKLVCGIAFPVDLNDKVLWRQLVMTYNLQFQFPLPTTPTFFSNKWSLRQFRGEDAVTPSSIEAYKDVAQLFLYHFAEEFMRRRGMNGRACLLRAICENAQIHHHQGLYAEILSRVLLPHESLDDRYLHAYHMGRHGVDCRSRYSHAQECLFDRYLHVREDRLQQTFVK